MKLFETITEYLKEAKPNDIITLSGRGLMDGISPQSKHDIYKVHKNTTLEKLVVTEYRGRKTLTTNELDQKVAVFSKKEFEQLPVLW